MDYNIEAVEKEILGLLQIKNLVSSVTKAEFRPHRNKRYSIKISYRSDKVRGFTETPKMEHKDAFGLYSKVLEKLEWKETSTTPLVRLTRKQ